MMSIRVFKKRDLCELAFTVTQDRYYVIIICYVLAVEWNENTFGNRHNYTHESFS